MKITIQLACGILGFLIFSALHAEPLPKWEFGLGLGSLGIADYRGSDEYSNRAFPFPYIVYRGKFLKADREGFRGQIFRSDRLEVNLSLNASLATSTDDNPLRAGMPELDPTFEAGPSLNIRLSDHAVGGWSLRLPLRAAIAFNEDTARNIGTLFNPHFIYRPSRRNPWNIRFSTGAYFAAREYHDYYYRVAPSFATPDRPAFDTKSGFSGISNQISLTRRRGNIWFGAYLRYDYIGGTQFADSPLVETEHYYAIGLGTGWIFATR